MKKLSVIILFLLAGIAFFAGCGEKDSQADVVDYPEIVGKCHDTLSSINELPYFIIDDTNVSIELLSTSDKYGDIWYWIENYRPGAEADIIVTIGEKDNPDADINSCYIEFLCNSKDNIILAYMLYSTTEGVPPFTLVED